MLSWSAHNKVNKTINKFIYLGENNFLKFSIDLPLQGILDLWYMSQQTTMSSWAYNRMESPGFMEHTVGHTVLEKQ